MDEDEASARLDTFAERIEDSAAAATNQRALLLKQMRKINNRLRKKANKVLQWSEIMANDLGYGSVTEYVDANKSKYSNMDEGNDDDDDESTNQTDVEDPDGENSALNLLYQIEQLEHQLAAEKAAHAAAAVEAEGFSQRVMAIGVENNRLKTELVLQRKGLRRQEEINIDLSNTMNTLQSCVKVLESLVD